MSVHVHLQMCDGYRSHTCIHNVGVCLLYIKKGTRTTVTRALAYLSFQCPCCCQVHNASSMKYPPSLCTHTRTVFKHTYGWFWSDIAYVFLLVMFVYSFHYNYSHNRGCSDNLIYTLPW